MNYLAFTISLIFFGLSSSAAAEYSILVNEEQKIDTSLHLIPNAASYANLLTNVMSSSVYLLEESGGFADIDQSKFSMHGDSWQHNDWYLNRFNISAPFFSGTAGFTVPFRSLGSLSIVNRGDPHQSSHPGIVLGLRETSSNQLEIRTDIPKVGDIFPFAIDIMNAISGLHIRKRGFLPPEERRHQPVNLRAQAQQSLSVWDTPVQTAFDYHQGTRRFLDFSPIDSEFKESFDESFIRGTAGLTMSPFGADEKLAVFYEHLQRDHLFAELHHSKLETVSYRADTLFAGYEAEQWNASALVKHFSFSHAEHEFAREIFDPDGESLYPFLPDGNHLGANLDFGYQDENVYLTINERIVHNQPKYSSWTNPLTYKGEEYGLISWEANPSLQSIGHDQMGVRDSIESGSLRFSYDIFLAHHHLFNKALVNTLTNFDAGIETELQWSASKSWRWFASLAKSPLPYTPELARTLDPDYMNGVHTLKDGRVVNTTGGESISVDSRLNPSNMYQTAVGFSHQISPHWKLNVQGLGRIFHQLYELKFLEDVEKNGEFVNGRFYLSEGPKSYLLTNTDQNPAAYWGGQIQVYGAQTDRYIFNFAFTVYAAIGYPVFGNGPTANDLAIVDYSSANPNSNINRLASFDGDRAFLFRLAMSRKLIDQLWGHLVISHRDGRPFSFFEDEIYDGQASFAHRSRRASPLKFSRPLAGPREDFRLNIDASLRYSFTLNELNFDLDLVGRNLFDFGNEISERFTYPQNTERAALEAEIPRSLLVSFRWNH